MAELRNLLEIAAGDQPSAVPMADIRRRGRAVTRRRQVLRAAAVVAAAAVLAAVLPRLIPVHPAPATPPTPSRSAVQPGLLKPGTYTDTVLNPHVTFDVPDGLPWRATQVTADSLILSSASGGPVISLDRWTHVYPPARTGHPAPNAISLPLDVIGWLARYPALQPLGPPEAVKFTNHSAHRLVFTIKPSRAFATGPPRGCAKPADCLTLAETVDGPLAIPSNVTTAITVPNDRQNGLILTVIAPGDPDLLDIRQIVNSLDTP